MQEDDATFGAAYRALIRVGRSLSARQRLSASIGQVFRVEVRVRFRKDHLLAQQAAWILSKALSAGKPARLARASL